MCLTIFLNGSDHAEYTRKANLKKTKVNVMKKTKVRADGNKLHTGKNEGQRPSSLGGRLIVVVSE